MPTYKYRQPAEPTLHDLHAWDVERRQDGAVIVRVRSRIVDGRALPDAVFAFRAGDPQFSFWEAQLQHREILTPSPLPLPMTLL